MDIRCNIFAFIGHLFVNKTTWANGKQHHVAWVSEQLGPLATWPPPES